MRLLDRRVDGEEEEEVELELEDEEDEVLSIELNSPSCFFTKISSSLILKKKLRTNSRRLLCDRLLIHCNPRGIYGECRGI